MAVCACLHHDAGDMLANGLYAIVDVDLTREAGFDILAFSEAVLMARPAAIQLRAKRLGGRAHLQLLEWIVRRAEIAGVPVFANDRPDLAILAGCTGVHVGQSDMTIADVRRLAPGLRVGLSTANEQQLQEALAAKPDYVALGPIFSTNSKADAEPAVGLDFLAAASRQAKQAQSPLVAIGGINHERAAAVAALAPLGAAISALIPKSVSLSDVAMLTRALHRALGGE